MQWEFFQQKNCQHQFKPHHWKQQICLLSAHSSGKVENNKAWSQENLDKKYWNYFDHLGWGGGVGRED